MAERIRHLYFRILSKLGYETLAFLITVVILAFALLFIGFLFSNPDIFIIFLKIFIIVTTSLGLGFLIFTIVNDALPKDVRKKKEESDDAE